MWEGRGSSVVGDRWRLDRNQIWNDRIDIPAGREQGTGCPAVGTIAFVRGRDGGDDGGDSEDDEGKKKARALCSSRQ